MPEADASRLSTYEKIERLPTPVGIVFMGIGVVGLIIPGPIGTPFILAGGLVLAPKLFGKVDGFVADHFPEFHRVGMDALERFVNDMEKRYPDESA